MLKQATIIKLSGHTHIHPQACTYDEGFVEKKGGRIPVVRGQCERVFEMEND